MPSVVTRAISIRSRRSGRASNITWNEEDAMTLYGYRVPMMASLLVWCLVWELVGQSGLMFLVPPLSSVLMAGVTMVQTGTWQAAALITLHSFAIGMVLAIVVGVTLGVLMGRFKAVDELFS